MISCLKRYLPYAAGLLNRASSLPVEEALVPQVHRWGNRKIPWRRKWQPTPAFLPGKSHGQGNLAGYSPGGLKESDMTEHTHTLPDRGILAKFGDSLVFMVQEIRITIG